MAQRDKLIARIRARPSQASAADVRTLLELFGYVDAGGKKHLKYQKPGHRTVIVPLVSGRHVKGVYLDQLCEILGLDDMP